MNKKELKARKFGKIGENAYDCVLEELKVLSRLEHPNVIWLHEIIDDDKKSCIYLVTEYHAKGSIGDLIGKLNDSTSPNVSREKDKKSNIRKGLKQADCRLYLIDMLKALYYCHKTIQVIHRDIKPDNIMINHNNDAVLIDFGVSALVDKEEDDNMETNMGTYIFYAPEMFERSSTNC